MWHERHRNGCRKKTANNKSRPVRRVEGTAQCQRHFGQTTVERRAGWIERRTRRAVLFSALSISSKRLGPNVCKISRIIGLGLTCLVSRNNNDASRASTDCLRGRLGLRPAAYCWKRPAGLQMSNATLVDARERGLFREFFGADGALAWPPRYPNLMWTGMKWPGPAGFGGNRMNLVTSYMRRRA